MNTKPFKDLTPDEFWQEINSSRFVAIIGPSGAGKGTVVQHLLSQKELSLKLSVSMTTRSQGSKEVNGVDYYFRKQPEFLALLEAGEFFEHQQVYEDQWYGTTKREIISIIRQGYIPLFDMDVKGAETLLALIPKGNLCIIAVVASEEVLLQRLRTRKRDNDDDIEKRIRKSREEMERISQLHKNGLLGDMIVNDSTKEHLCDRAKKEVKEFFMNHLIYLR